MNGSCEWFIPDCYWPEITTPGLYVSHEAICVLNSCAEDANIELTLYFEDAEPIEGFTAKCPARRTHHIRLDKLTDALKCQLRHDMLHTYYRHREDHTIRQYELEDFLYLYRGYKALGGNSFIDRSKSEIDEWEVVS